MINDISITKHMLFGYNEASNILDLIIVPINIWPTINQSYTLRLNKH